VCPRVSSTSAPVKTEMVSLDTVFSMYGKLGFLSNNPTVMSGLAMGTDTLLLWSHGMTCALSISRQLSCRHSCWLVSWVNCMIAAVNSRSDSPLTWVLALSWDWYAAGRWCLCDSPSASPRLLYVASAGKVWRMLKVCPCRIMRRCMTVSWAV
jgi:hypothetical protein